MFFTFLLVISLLKRVTRHSDKVLSSVPKHREAMMYHMEKIRVLDKLHSGLSYHAIGHEVNVSELICIK